MDLSPLTNLKTLHNKQNYTEALRDDVKHYYYNFFTKENKWENIQQQQKETNKETSTIRSVQLQLYRLHNITQPFLFQIPDDQQREPENSQK